MCTEIIKRIYDLGEKLRGRLEQWKIDSALEYIEHNEVPLAFEMLCDHLCDDGILIYNDEFREILNIGSFPGMELHQLNKKMLKSLVIDSK
ncbi:Hypothetical protein GbCGDNIH3_7262 [Granulibacter bethesdensis]|uniref:Uncharacterized protein n=1 Tax=Granulibacter bethesdensis TaxID=364410 RepID=A0AAN0REJ4_9PROT|nr:MafI family immunity protein [Granulibacter bethesdensis]AHJ63562.1 Hypothetical protein GbCGDNIH3_7262 [Granulibacter bethesdensis]